MIRYLRVFLYKWAVVLPLGMACMPSSPSSIAKPIAPPPTPLLPNTAGDAWRNQQPKPGSEGQFRIPIPQVHKLDNGITVYCISRNVGTVSMSLVVNRGAEESSSGKAGTAALLTRLLTESTSRRNAFQLAEAAEAFGSSLMSSAQRDHVAISLDSLPSDFEKAIDLISEVVRQPAWSTQDFARVKNQWLDDLQAERQSPGTLASLVALRAIYGTHRGAPVNGSITDIKNLTLRDLRSWYQRFIGPSNAALVVVGPIDTERVVAAAKKALGEWRGESHSRTDIQYEATKRESNRVIVVDRKGAVQSAIFVAQPFPRRLESGYEARLILSNILGGLFTSRINMNLREEHAYTYGAHSTVIANRNFGIFATQTSVRTDATAPALKELLSELAAVTSPTPKKPLTAMELARSRSDLVHRLAAHLEQNRFLVGDIETIFSQGLSPQYFSLAPEIYSSLTLHDISVQVGLLAPNSMTIVVVGDRASIELPLTQSGYIITQPESGWDD
jgi:zinc protease